MLNIQSHSLRFVPTAHLAQTMTLLGLSVQELQQKIETELASNPALELVSERRCPTCHRKLSPGGICQICSRPISEQHDEPIVFLSDRIDHYSSINSTRSWESESSTDDNGAVVAEDLPGYILRQISTELAVQDREIAAHILTSLDDDGLLTISKLEIARYLHVLPSRIEKVLDSIKRADPIGCGSTTPEEAMLAQLKFLGESNNIPTGVEEIIKSGIDLLAKKQFTELARHLKLPQSKIIRAAEFIAENLYPYPGRAHWGDIRSGSASPLPTYSSPDIVINLLTKDDTNSALIAEVMTPIQGTLRVNPLFRKAILDALPEKLEAWRADLEQANLLVKCIQQRNNTMKRLAFELCKNQRGFILNGDAELVPMTRASIAETIGVHESTISRAVSSKSAQLPSGKIIPLERFFDRSLNVRTVLKHIVASEKRPLTDTQLVARLQERGYDVARRTVAKYRSMEGILPARLRQPEMGAV